MVEVGDDGVGGADFESGSGLQGLRDRVAAVSGTLDMASRPGAGTVLRARLPIAVP
jgi:signal transduction histidine kinase